MELKELKTQISQMEDPRRTDRGNIRHKLLNYELNHFSRVSPAELIEGMSLSHGCELTARSGQVSDKTFFIALNYQECEPDQ